MRGGGGCPFKSLKLNILTFLKIAGLPRETLPAPNCPDGRAAPPDPAAGDFAARVERAKDKFRVGDLFETVLSQTFSRQCAAPPSVLFAALRQRNPSPYGFVVNLGGAEHLIGASPEMYVRVRGGGRTEHPIQFYPCLQN